MIEPDTVLHIRSSAHPDGRPCLLLSWHGHDWVAETTEIATTARDLAAAAATAEAEANLMSVLTPLVGRDISVEVLLDVRAKRPPRYGSKATLFVEPIVSAVTLAASVTLRRGKKEGKLSPDEARQMAQDWTEALIAAEQDANVRAVLRAIGVDEPGVEGFFGQLAVLTAARTGGNPS